MRRIAAALTVAGCLGPSVQAGEKEARRLEACRDVFLEAMGIKEGIPPDLFRKAECIAVIPGVKKAALGVGGRFGFGAIACRRKGEPSRWTAPLMMSLKGGSIGFQIGGQENDLVLLFMNPRAIDSLLGSKFTLGADASVAAGPVGRSVEAATDAQMRAEILSYSRSRGVFAGLSLEGAVLKQDEGANRRLYRRDVKPRAVLIEGRQRVPRDAAGFLEALEEFSGR